MKTAMGIGPMNRTSMNRTSMNRTGKFLAMLALLAIPAGAAGAHAFPEHRHGHHHRHDAGHKQAWHVAAETTRQRFEVKINTIWCGPATAAAAPQWCGG